MSMHPDFDALSASLDGEDEEARAHALTCEECAAQVASLAAVREAVGRPVPPLAADRREAALAAALGEFGRGTAEVTAPTAAATPAPAAPTRAPAPVVELASRRWQWVAGSAVAAVLVLVVGMAALFGQGGQRDESTTALRAPEAQSEDGKVAVAADSSAGTATAAGGSGASQSSAAPVDLGEVANVEALRARYATVVAQPTARANSGAASSLSGQSGVPPVVTVGTRACEIEARAVRPSLGVVAYQATARFAGTPAVVLGFSSTAGGPPTVLLVLSEQGCRLLGEATLP